MSMRPAGLPSMIPSAQIQREKEFEALEARINRLDRLEGYVKTAESLNEFISELTPSRKSVITALKVVAALASLAGVEDIIMKTNYSSMSGFISITTVAGLATYSATEMGLFNPAVDRAFRNQVLTGALALNALIASACLAPGRILPEVVDNLTLTVLHLGLILYPFAVLGSAYMGRNFRD